MVMKRILDLSTLWTDYLLLPFWLVFGRSITDPFTKLLTKRLHVCTCKCVSLHL